MELGVLQELGFTQAEAKVYLTLLKLGSVKVGSIIEKSGLQSSTIHNTLHSLIDKGFVSYVLKGKIKVYQAVGPKLILRQYKEKEKRFTSLLPKLEMMQKYSKEKQSVELFEGMKGITTMYNELIEDSKPGDNFYFFATDVSGANEDIQKFYVKYDVKRKAKKLNIKGIARKSLKKLFLNRGYIKMKYVNFPIPSNIGICNNKMVLINWGERPSGILIKSKQIIDSQIEFFKELWKSS